MFVYHQRMGTMSTSDGNPIGTGYSGRDTGLNNPVAQEQADTGPIPRGLWELGDWQDHPELGPNVCPLTPVDKTRTYGRFGFFIHGDNAACNHSASHGCIVLGKIGRDTMRTLGSKYLVVLQ